MIQNEIIDFAVILFLTNKDNKLENEITVVTLNYNDKTSMMFATYKFH